MMDRRVSSRHGSRRRSGVPVRASLFEGSRCRDRGRRQRLTLSLQSESLKRVEFTYNEVHEPVDIVGRGEGIHEREFEGRATPDGGAAQHHFTALE
jgi:hypothetical protein